MALRAMSPLSPLAYHAAADCDDEDEPRASQEATQEEPEQAQPFSPQLEAPSTAGEVEAVGSQRRGGHSRQHSYSSSAAVRQTVASVIPVHQRAARRCPARVRQPQRQ